MLWFVQNWVKIIYRPILRIRETFYGLSARVRGQLWKDLCTYEDTGGIK